MVLRLTFECSNQFTPLIKNIFPGPQISSTPRRSSSPDKMNTTTSPCAPVTSSSTVNHHHSSNFDNLPGKPKRTSNPKQGTRNHVPKLKISVINFCGIRSKIASLQAFLENNKPDIIIGTETHLSPDISNCELFPASYKIIRKDRNPHGGGVLIATKSSISVTHHTNMDSDCEII